MASKKRAVPSAGCLASSFLAVEPVIDNMEPSMRGLGRLKHFARGSVLFRDRECDFALGLIVSGSVAVWKLRGDGNNRVLSFLGPNEIVSPEFFRSPVLELEAASEVIVRCLSAAQLKEALLKEPCLADLLMEAASSQLSAAVSQVALVGGNRIGSLRHFFLRIVSRPLDGDRTVVSIKRNHVVVSNISRTALAAHIGVSSSRLSHMLRSLQEAGLIRALTPHRFEILDFGRLSMTVAENF